MIVIVADYLKRVEDSALVRLMMSTYKRLKSTVDCSDNISSLFMVALGAGADNRPEVSRYSTDEKYSKTYKQLMQWFLMCLKIHGLYSGVVLWYFGVYYAATLPDQASWTGSRGVLLGNMYLAPGVAPGYAPGYRKICISPKAML
ncbi:hypothetical protein T4B_1292 [Trichinella pseudospiralis]|uniref:Uncharacterized protein n=1 Tax=Trichinella pseudospiralis TaxID=6337 RepID=A0A0V1GTE2_TRIPS|nr:hypothetical protein T4B_1292 [Trichinella pseudospiralis]